MTRHIYIDAYNVLHKVPQLARLMKSNADAARRGLVEMVAMRAVSGASMHIVFDSFGEQIGGGSGVSVVYAMTRTADAWIRMRIERDPNPRASLVVSSDHEVLSHASAMGAATQTAEDFLRSRPASSGTSAEAAKQNRSLSKSEIDEWMTLFNARDE